MTYTIYHNPRCQKSRQTLELLQKHKIDIKIIEYLKTPFTVAGLENVLQKLKLKPSQLIRRKEERFKKLNLDLDDEKKVFEALIQYPELIERPIVVVGNSAALGRPPENVLELIKK